MTGLDLSTGMLALAGEAARAAGVSVELIHADATAFSFPGRFDAAVYLCEGAFGLLSQSDDPIEQPLAILRNVSRNLKPHARMLHTTLSAACKIRAYPKREGGEGEGAGIFDPVTMVESSEYPPREDRPDRRSSRTSS